MESVVTLLKISALVMYLTGIVVLIAFRKEKDNYFRYMFFYLGGVILTSSSEYIQEKSVISLVIFSIASIAMTTSVVAWSLQKKK